MIRAFFFLFVATTIFFSCDRAPVKEIGDLRALEHRRINALVQVDIDRINKLHADYFELVTPEGDVYNKEQYLGKVKSGELDYEVWQPGEIEVLLYEDAALTRYKDSKIVLKRKDDSLIEGVLTHTNLWERKNREWKIVWSHSSGGDIEESDSW